MFFCGEMSSKLTGCEFLTDKWEDFCVQGCEKCFARVQLQRQMISTLN